MGTGRIQRRWGDGGTARRTLATGHLGAWTRTSRVASRLDRRRMKACRCHGRAGAVGSGAVGSGAVGSGAVGAGAVGSGAVGSGAVAGVVGSGAVGAGAVGSGAVGAGAVGAGAVGAGAVGSGAVAGAVGSGTVGAGAVGSGAVGAGAVGSGAVGPGAVGSGAVRRGAVGRGAVGRRHTCSRTFTWRFDRGSESGWVTTVGSNSWVVGERVHGARTRSEGLRDAGPPVLGHMVTGPQVDVLGHMVTGPQVDGVLDIGALVLGLTVVLVGCPERAGSSTVRSWKDACSPDDQWVGKCWESLLGMTEKSMGYLSLERLYSMEMLRQVRRWERASALRKLSEGNSGMCYESTWE
eukprot:972129-Amorphochlora_amoeboformis.AAC.2